jgi:hypothetical protein
VGTQLLKGDVLNQLDALIQEGQRLLASFKMDAGSYWSEVPEADFRTFAIKAFAAIDRIAGTNSEFYSKLPDLRGSEPLSVPGYHNTRVPGIQGALVALRDAVEKRLLVSLEAAVRANIHDDFLQQARVLLDSHYHVAAMVLIGGVLEDHLEKMCVKHGLPSQGNGTIAKYNDLLHGNAYDKPIWRRIQSIGDLRNEAAHGNFAKVNAPDVEDAHKFVGRVLADYPA